MKNKLGLSLLLASNLALGHLSADVAKKEASESLNNSHLALEALDNNKTKCM